MRAEDAAAADAAFGTDLYTRLAGPGNLVFSPASIAAALDMALLGARGETAAELARGLHLPDAEAARDANLQLTSIPVKDELALRVVNTAWIDAQLDVLNDYLDQPVSVARADFRHQPEAARGVINAAVAEQTAGKVAQLIGPGLLDTLTRLVLVNAIYLKARWEHEFPVGQTRKEAFFPERSGSAQVDMMHLQAALAYTRGDGYQAVLLPYKGGPVALAVVLPDGPLWQFSIADHGGVAGVLRGLLAGEQCQVDLRLPKFRVEASFQLRDTLTALGMRRAFSDAADFSGITRQEPLRISAVVHKAFIDVDEQGTEAAAATAVAIVMASLRMPPPRRVVLTIDRPFLFAVVDTTAGLPLFLGQYTRP